MKTIADRRLACKGHRARHHGDYAVTRSVSAALEVLEGSGGGAPKAAMASAAFNSLGLDSATIDAIERELAMLVPMSALPEFRATLREFDRLRRARVRSAVTRPPKITRPHRAQRSRA